MPAKVGLIRDSIGNSWILWGDSHCTKDWNIETLSFPGGYLMLADRYLMWEDECANEITNRSFRIPNVVNPSNGYTDFRFDDGVAILESSKSDIPSKTYYISASRENFVYSTHIVFSHGEFLDSTRPWEGVKDEVCVIYPIEPLKEALDLLYSKEG